MLASTQAATLVIGDWVYAVVMALVQGLTEFIPVSSSGQLSILNMLFGGEPAGAVDFYFFLHIPTLIAAIVYFRNDIKDIIISWLPANRESMSAQRRITVFLIIAMLVTGPMGLVFSSRLDAYAANMFILGSMFIVTALMLVSSEYALQKMKQHRSMDKLTPARAAGIGFIQGLAVIPGISRSGSTIAAGLWMGMSREQATRFSFLLTIPVIVAGSLRDTVRWVQGDLVLPSFWISAIAFVIAGIVGYLTIAWMIRLVQRTSLNFFAIYAALLGVILIFLHFYL